MMEPIYLKINGEYIPFYTQSQVVILTGVKPDTLKMRRIQKTYKRNRDYFEISPREYIFKIDLFNNIGTANED